MIPTFTLSPSPVEHFACYDEGKPAETLFMDYHRMHGVDIRIIRIFNTYGPSDAPLRRSSGIEFHHAGFAQR